MRGSGRRDGFVLLGVLATLLVLGIAAVASAAVASAVARVQESRLQAERARLAAVSGVHAAIDDWPADSVASLAPGERFLLAPGGVTGGGRYQVTVERLAVGRALVRSRGWVEESGSPRAELSIGRAVTLLCGCDLGDSIDAAVEVAGSVAVPAGGKVEAFGVAAIRVDSGVVPESLAGTVSGDPPLDASGFTPLGAAAAWSALADHEAAGTLAPSPTLLADGSCDKSVASNWGDPSSSASACSGYAPVIRAPSSLRLDGGLGQGILIAEQELVLAAGSRYDGLVLAFGPVRVEAGASLFGAIVAASPAARVEVAGEVILDPAALVAALSSALEGRPFEASGRRWTALF
ncbi:MAG: hypothetical protein ABFS34_04345 [Gemmatimonadota bacterium]